MKIFLFSTFKGGTGKTMLSALSALELAERGYKIMVCDLDGQGNLTQSLHGCQKVDLIQGLPSGRSGLGHDCIIIDCPPAVTAEVRKALCLADYIISPTCADQFAVDSIGYIQKVMSDLGALGKLLCVPLNRFSARCTIDRLIMGKLEEKLGKYGVPVITIAGTVSAREALLCQETVSKKSPAYAGLKALADLMEKMING